MNSWWARSLALRFAETPPSQIGNACKSTWNRCALCNYIHPQEQGLCLGVWCIVFVFAYSQHRIYLETEWQCRHHRTEPLLLLTLVSLPILAVLTSLYSMYHQYVMILYSIFNPLASLSTIALLASFVFLALLKSVFLFKIHPVDIVFVLVSHCKTSWVPPPLPNYRFGENCSL